MELTQEAFEHILNQRLEQTETSIIKRIDETQEELAAIIANTVVEPFTERLDRLEKLFVVQQDVQRLKEEMAEIRTALHLSHS